MAFIRWKPDASGGRHAYLVRAYRGPDGRPKQKVLAYLGRSAELTPEKIAFLRKSYPELKVDWQALKPAVKPQIDFSTLSDSHLLKQIRKIRRHLNLSQIQMVWKLEEKGMPRCTSEDYEGSYLGNRMYGQLEKALELGDPQAYYQNPEAEIVPALRKLFEECNAQKTSGL